MNKVDRYCRERYLYNSVNNTDVDDDEDDIRIFNDEGMKNYALYVQILILLHMNAVSK